MELINGDCLEEMKKMPDEYIDLVVTSPPYDNLRTYKNNLNWNMEIFKKVANELYRVIKKGGCIIWVVGDATINGSETGTSFKQALYFKEIGLNIHDTMIYAKKNPIPKNHNRYEQEFEYMFLLTKGKPNTFNPIIIPCKCAGEQRDRQKTIQMDKKQCMRVRNQITTCKKEKIATNIFYYGIGGGKTGHPAVFPLQLAIDQIKSWTNEKDIVLDPFMGSGTTGVACKELNRNFIGIEIVPEYYQIAKKRIEETINQKTIDDIGGKE